MTKEEKVCYIKCWLQKFGDRDNETFNTEVVTNNITWRISMQYNFSDEGNQIDPYDWCCKSFKHVHDNSISDRTEEELDEIITQLKLKKSYY